MAGSAVYADGRPYRAPISSLAPRDLYLFRKPATPILNRHIYKMSWPGFWQVTQSILKRAHFRRGTLKVYRQVLRAFAAFVDEQRNHCSISPFPSVPADAEDGFAREFIYALNDRHVSASWLSTNISVLRTVFDKL